MINNFEMRPYVIVILLFLIYGFPAFISLLFETETQISFNYVYLGVLMCLTQISNSLFSLNLSEKIDLNAGDISYTALLFTALFLVIAQPKPIVVRKMIFIFVMLSTFLFFIFMVLANILGNLENATNYYNIDPQLFHYSYKSLIYSIVLFTTETTILLFLLKKTLPYFKSKWASLIALTTIFLVVIVLDGVLYPAGINLLYGESLFSIKKGVIAKLIFGTGFGTMILVFLWIFPEKMKAFIAVDEPLRNYIL